MNDNLSLRRYKRSTKSELEKQAIVMERILLLIAPISLLVLLNGVLFFRAFIDWVLLRRIFTPILMLCGLGTLSTLYYL